MTEESLKSKKPPDCASPSSNTRHCSEMLEGSAPSGVGGQLRRRRNSLKKMVMSAPNMRWKGSREAVSSATIQEQIFNLGISKETNSELARDLCREAKQERYEKCRAESARNRSCSARSSSSSTQAEAFASVRHRYLPRLEASTLPCMVAGMPWKWRTPAWWGKIPPVKLSFLGTQK